MKIVIINKFTILFSMQTFIIYKDAIPFFQIQNFQSKSFSLRSGRFY